MSDQGDEPLTKRLRTKTLPIVQDPPAVDSSDPALDTPEKLARARQEAAWLAAQAELEDDA